jgi:hypothetical protein
MLNNFRSLKSIESIKLIFGLAVLISTKVKDLHFLKTGFPWFFKKGVSLIIVVMILNSNFQMALIKEDLISTNGKMILFPISESCIEIGFIIIYY